jgi:hypothetical protein
MFLFVGNNFTAIGLLGATFSLWMLTGKRMQRVLKTVGFWYGMERYLGVVFFVFLLNSESCVEKVDFLFGHPPSIVGSLLAHFGSTPIGKLC